MTSRDWKYSGDNEACPQCGDGRPKAVQLGTSKRKCMSCDYVFDIEEKRDMTTTLMKERLARALWNHDTAVLSSEGCPTHESWETTGRQQNYLAQVDAILREMLEPSEGMLFAQAKATKNVMHLPTLRKGWAVMIRYIIDEGLPTHEDVLGILNESQD